MKQLLTLLLPVVLVVLTFSCQKKHEYVFSLENETVIDSGKVNNVSWMFTEEGTLFVTGKGAIPDYGFRGRSDLRTRAITLVIDEGITGIGSVAFSEYEKLTRVILPGTLEEIGIGAFEYCESLTEIRIPARVKILREYTFQYCTSLKKVTLSNGLEATEYGVFGWCESLSDISLPNTFTTLGNATFYACSDLNRISLPKSLRTIGSNAFWASGLSGILIPENVTSIGIAAFGGNPNLKNIGVDPGNSNFSSKDGVLFDKTQSTLCFFPWGQAADSYTIPSSVKTIGNSAFAEYPLQEIVLPDHIEKIEPKAFSNCSKLSKIRFPNNEAFLIGEGAFLDCRALTELSLPKNATSIGNAAFSGCSGLKKIGLDAANPNYTVSDGVLFDKAKTRLICYPAGRAETDYMVPAGVKVISSRSFLSCQYLVRAILPDGLTDIEEYAFAFCPALNTVNIPESVTTIGTGIFYGSPKMPYLPGVSFHSGVTEMPVTFSSHGHFVPRS